MITFFDTSLYQTVRDKLSKAQLKELSGHKKRIYTLDWMLNSNTLISGSVDTTIRLWDITTENFQELKNHNDSVTIVKSSLSEPNQFISASADKHIKLWDIRTNKAIKSEKTKAGIRYISYNSSNTELAFSNKDGDAIHIYDIGTFSQINQFDFKSKVNEFEYDKTSSILFVTNDNGNINLINAKTYRESDSKVIECHLAPTNSISIDYNDNKHFITGGVDSLIVQWNMEEMMSSKVYKKGDQAIRKVQYSFDGKYIASIYDGVNVEVFSTECGAPVHTINTENIQYSIAWNRNKNVNKNILAYCGDEKNNRNGDEGNLHLMII